jgi:ureidoacrylate peracid hydrolase
MKEIRPNTTARGTLPPHKFALDPEKLGMMNKINWQKYVRPENTAFIMVDYENDAMSPGGNLFEISANPMWEALGGFKNTLKLVKAARKHKMKVFWVRYGLWGIDKDIPLDSPQGEWLAMLQAEFPGAFLRDTWDYEIIDELQAVMEPQDIIIDKSTFSTFVGTNLERYLALQGIKNIILGGCMTDSCVEGTARSAFDLGYYPLVVADATACNTWDDQYGALYYLSRMMATIVMTDEIVDVLQRNSQG